MAIEMSKRRALGRGLGALIPGGDDVDGEARARASRDYFLAAIEDVHPSPSQPRKRFEEKALEELARSIKAEGIIQPLVVRQRKGGGFELIAGERRWRASQRAGLRQVPVVVKDVAENHAFELALVENVQRADLNAIEEAEAYQQLQEKCGYTQEQIAERVGKDRATIANAIRLLKLPPRVRQMVEDGELSMGHARALLGLDDAERIEVTARKVVARGLSVRVTEDLVRKARDGGKEKSGPAPKSPTVRDLEERLSRALGARVTVQDRGGNKGGKIEIAYANLDDLDRLLERLLDSRTR